MHIFKPASLPVSLPVIAYFFHSSRIKDNAETKEELVINCRFNL